MIYPPVIEIMVPSKWAYEFTKKYNIELKTKHEQEITTSLGTKEWYRTIEVPLD